ncbi:MAG: addiction module toxin, HicA family [Bacteroidetes bacterium]|nr:addiction module toxin, HicA family [Bacteroidota bacterium]
MGNIPVLSPTEVVSILLLQLGFIETRQKGSHKRFRREENHSSFLGW